MLYPLSYGGNPHNLQDLKQTSEINALIAPNLQT